MVNMRQNNLLNRNISSESPMDGGLNQSGTPQGLANMTGRSSTPMNTATIPEGFVNFDRLLTQNRGTLENKANQLNDVAGKVQSEVSGLSSGLHGAGMNKMDDVGIGGLMSLALDASKGNADAKKKLEMMLNPSSVEENKPVTESSGYTSGVNTLNKALLAPKEGQDNYGGGSLDFALGDATYGNKIRDQIAQSSAALEKAKAESVMKNKEIQDYNKNIGSYRDKQRGQAVDALNAAQGVADNPTQTLVTGDPFYRVQDAQNATLSGMRELAKYLGIDPNSIKGKEQVMPDWMSTVWNKEQNQWVSPDSLTPPKTPEQTKADMDKAAADAEDKIPPEAKRRAERARERSDY